MGILYLWNVKQSQATALKFMLATVILDVSVLFFNYLYTCHIHACDLCSVGFEANNECNYRDNHTYTRSSPELCLFSIFEFFYFFLFSFFSGQTECNRTHLQWQSFDLVLSYTHVLARCKVSPASSLHIKFIQKCYECHRNKA